MQATVVIFIISSYYTKLINKDDSVYVATPLTILPKYKTVVITFYVVCLLALCWLGWFFGVVFEKDVLLEILVNEAFTALNFC